MNTALKITAGLLLAGSLVQAADPGLDAAWADLAAADEARAALAILKLGGSPQQAVALIKERIQPVKADPQRVARLIAQLDDNDFTVRQQAGEDLEYLGKYVKDDLEKALKGNASAEAKQRLQQLLNKLPKPVQAKEMPPPANPNVNRVAIINGRVLINGVEVNAQPPVNAVPQGPPMTWIRAVRAIAVLEHIGSSEARQLLEALAQGEADALPTKEAQAALGRLKGR